MDDTQSRELQRKKRRQRRKRISIAGKILTSIFFLFLLCYAAMLVYTSNFTMLITEQADLYEISDSVEVEAVALRSEQYITNSKKGIISYTLDDGEKVRSGGTVARLFNSENEVENWQRYNTVQSELELLQQMTNSADKMFVDLDTVNLQIKNEFVFYKNQITQNKLNMVSQSKYELLKLFNEKTVVTGGSADFDERIASLQNELDSIPVSEGIGTVKSKNSGFFSSKTDGFELSLNYDDVEKMTADDVNNMIKKDPPSNSVGKVIDTINWYLLCPVTSEQALMAAAGNSVVDVSIPRVMSGSIPANVVGVNQNSKTSNGLLILKSDYMDAAIANIRKENIAIKTYTYSGLRVSRSAIHNHVMEAQDYDSDGEEVGEPYEKEFQGVYVLYGKRLRFVPVHIIYADSDFVICSNVPNDPELKGNKTIALHDTIVVKGKELYDDKIVR